MRALLARPRAWLLPRSRPVPRETVHEYVMRRAGRGSGVRFECVHPEAVAHNPLPRNVPAREALADDQGWWGFSFRDVPARVSGETFVATLPDCTVAWYRDPELRNDFFPAIVTDEGTALDFREVRFRPRHAEVLRRRPRPARLRKATWILERVYHNHSHWLTAHLPKLLLLRQRDALDDMLLPPERPPAMDDSLRLLGLEPSSFPTFDAHRPLRVDALTVMGTDRFRPELLRLVPEAYGVLDAPRPHRRVFISRARAARRRLVNESDIWPLLEAAGFERVQMEALPFTDQVRLMRETAVIFAPHGAGLTNMLFCRPGAHVIEIADLGFPNPNFYALASALSHHYWLVPGEGLGDCHPLEKDLSVRPEAVSAVLESLG
jgi:hypothetical protein